MYSNVLCLCAVAYGDICRGRDVYRRRYSSMTTSMVMMRQYVNDRAIFNLTIIAVVCRHIW